MSAIARRRLPTTSGLASRLKPMWVSLIWTKVRSLPSALAVGPALVAPSALGTPPLIVHTTAVALQADRHFRASLRLGLGSLMIQFLVAKGCGNSRLSVLVVSRLYSSRTRHSARTDTSSVDSLAIAGPALFLIAVVVAPADARDELGAAGGGAAGEEDDTHQENAEPADTCRDVMHSGHDRATRKTLRPTRRPREHRR